MLISAGAKKSMVNVLKLNLVHFCKIIIPTGVREPIVNFLKLYLLILCKMLIRAVNLI